MTPMLKQYRAIKEKHADCLLFFRLGDFYEMFYEDAILASKLLGITLTARYKGSDKETPMCGVPHHSVFAYIAKLVQAGHKVAICEQLSDPALPGIVERAVTRVITPGTVLEDKLLDEKSNNYILSLVQDSTGYALAYADLSTGEFRVTKIADYQVLRNELNRIQPAEVLIPSRDYDQPEVQKLLNVIPGASKFPYDSLSDSRQALLTHFAVQNLRGLGLEEEELQIRAAALLLNYLSETQKSKLGHLTSLQHYELGDYMPLDSETLRNLEILINNRGEQPGSLLASLDHCVSSLGSRKLRQWLLHPLLKQEALIKRQEAVAELLASGSRLTEIRESLKHGNDLERLVSRISLARCQPRDLLGLFETLQLIPALKKLLIDYSAPALQQVHETLDPLNELASLINKTISADAPVKMEDGGYIKEGVDQELDELRRLSSSGKAELLKIQQREQERTGIGSLKVRYNQVFGYYLEISKSNLKNVPADYIRKQTLVNAERFITPELKEYEDKILGAEDKILKIEARLFENLRQQAAAESTKLLKNAESLAELDIYGSFAHQAQYFHYVRPSFNTKGTLEIKDGRHPVIEQLQGPGHFVPNDTNLEAKSHFLLITGPNMAGKSTYLRQVALICLLAQIGSFVPARSADLPLLDRIFTRIGASDYLSAGQSTFMVEMQETANILHNATKNSLVILDEIGRGTSTYDGLSLAWALTEYLHTEKKCLTLFATHYHELIELISELPEALNYHVAAEERDGQIAFLYKLQIGGVSKSYGLEVAKLAGLPNAVIARAREVLKELEQSELREDSAGQVKRLSDKQTPLFELTAPSSKITDELKQIDPNQLTPLQALAKLQELKERYEQD